MPKKLNKENAFLLFCCATFFMASFSGVCRAETVKIPVIYREAADVLPLVKTMLSPGGEAVVDELTNSLIITDNQEAIRKIRAFLPEVDVLGRLVRVSVKFKEVGSSEDRSLSARGRVKGDGWEVKKGRKKREGVTIDVVGKSTHTRRSSDSFISVTSGSSAYILAGEDIPYRERWLYLSRRYAQLVETIVFQRVETGMEVRPVVTGKMARIDITPRIAYESKEGRKGTVRFTSAQTTLSVPLGQWVSIGGTSEKENEIIKALLESGRGNSSSSMAIFLKVEAN